MVHKTLSQDCKTAIILMRRAVAWVECQAWLVLYLVWTSMNCISAAHHSGSWETVPSGKVRRSLHLFTDISPWGKGFMWRMNSHNITANFLDWGQCASLANSFTSRAKVFLSFFFFFFGTCVH
jgi:hypothetical protein